MTASLQIVAAAKEIRVGAAVTAVFSEVDGVFTLKEGHKDWN